MTDDSPAENPYAPPVAASREGAHEVGIKNGKRAIQLLVAAIAMIFVSFFIGTVFRAIGTDFGARLLWIVSFGAVPILALCGVASGIVSLVQRVRSPLGAHLGFTITVLVAVLANGFMSLVGAVFTFFATGHFSRGRQLRRFGRVLLPPVRAGGAFAQVPLGVTVEDSLRPALAAQWRENGRTEHASVAAFARLTLDLMALGAPPALLSAANRDALDEIRHTELCFSLARALDGKSEGPAAFPEASRARTLPATRTLALAALAVDSLVDGALHEGVSARVIAKLARRCEEPQIRAVLKEIAADEGRHAAHGWDVVQWCLAEGGSAVADALHGALQALPRTMRSPLPGAAEDGGWEKFGIHGRALEVEEFASTRADLVRRMERMIGDQQASAA